MWWSLALNLLVVCICNTSGSILDPVFAAAIYEASVNETFIEGGIMQPEPGFLTVSCNQSNDSDLEYMLMSKEVIPFTVDSATGDLAVSDDLDYETTTLYNFTAVCTVAGNLDLADSSIVIVYLLPVNEYRPNIQPTPMVTVIVNELTPLGLLTVTTPGNMFSVVDMDAPADTIHYSLQAINGTAEGLAVYSETLQGVVLTQAYDRESVSNSTNCLPHPQLEFRVTVCDVYPPDSQCPNLFLIVLFSPTNDNAPTFSQTQYSTRVAESAPINSTLVAVTCTDEDVCIGALGRIHLQIVDQNMTKFSINQNGDIFNTEILDYEETLSYNLTVRCFDSGSGQSQRDTFATVEIQLADVNDNSPRCSPTPTGSLAAGSHHLTSVLHLSCVDDDSGVNSQLTYAVVGDLPQAIGGSFTLDPTTGELQFTGELRPDEEFEFSVDISDSGLPPQSSRVQVRVTVTGETVPTVMTQELQVSRAFPMLLIIMACVVGGLLLLCCLVLLLCCGCFCLRSRHGNKSKKVIFYNPNQSIAYQNATPFAPDSFEGEREISLYVDEEPSGQSSGQSTPISAVSHDLLTGEHVITNTVMVVTQDKDPLGLVAAVTQHLDIREGELQGTQPNEDSIAVTIDQEVELQHTIQPHSAPVQDITSTQMPVQDTTKPQSIPVQDTTQTHNAGQLEGHCY